MKSKTYKLFKIILAFFLCIIVIYIIYLLFKYFIPFIFSLKDPIVREHFECYIKSLGLKGIILMLLLQIVQVFSGIIPNEPVQILFGMLYGTFLGGILSFIGIFIGTIGVCYSTKLLGKNFIYRILNSKRLAKFTFLDNTKKLKTILIFLFFIPGIPKDILLYASCLTSLKTKKILYIATLSRIPAIFIATFTGSSLTHGDLLRSIILFSLTAIFAVIGILVNFIINKKKSTNKKGA